MTSVENDYLKRNSGGKIDELLLEFIFLSQEKLASSFAEFFKGAYGWTQSLTRSMCYLKKEGRISISELAARVNTSRQHMTYLIDSMEEMGLAVRIHDPNNRRTVLVEATEQGLVQLDDGERRFISHMLQTMNGISSAQSQELIDAIRKVCIFLSNLDMAISLEQ